MPSYVFAEIFMKCVSRHQKIELSVDGLQEHVEVRAIQPHPDGSATVGSSRAVIPGSPNQGWQLEEDVCRAIREASEIASH